MNQPPRPRRPRRLLPAALAAVLCAPAPIARADDLATAFQSPPPSARPRTWWHWMNGNVSRDGIAKDLEAMSNVGLGGFELFNVSNGIPRGPVEYLSDEWKRDVAHAISTAARLNLEMCFHNCAGWSSSGGPWITPAQSMQEIVWTETTADGGKPLELKLEQPTTRRDFYKDIAVVAFPTLKGDAVRNQGFRLKDWSWKIDRNTPGRKPDAPLVRDTRQAPDGDVIKPGSALLLTDQMSPDGTLKWDAPPGHWTLLRFGQTTTGRTNKPAAWGGEGLECNKLDRAAVKVHWDHGIAPILALAGPNVGKTLNDILIDSYEVGFQNWTDGFDKEFARRTGYDLAPFFPCLTGRVVGSVEETERFLWDYRRVIADLMADNYFGYFKELAHSRGLTLSSEPYNLGGFDYFQIAALADIPMGELWFRRDDAWHKWSSKLASSAAHATGRPVTGAEALTAGPPGSEWNDSPYAVKTTADRMFLDGVNRLIFHTDAHQPWPDSVKPGMTMGPHGIQFNRNNTWYPHARPWVDHLTRTQAVLQQGRFVADLCYLAPEEVPQPPLNRADMSPVPPPGYDYDILFSGLVLQMSVKDGQLELPSGMTYRMLVLPDDTHLRPELLEKVKQLVDAGAVVYAPKRPTASPSLKGQPASDQKVRALVEELWSTGKVKTGPSLEEAMKSSKIARDFESTADNIDYLHRTTDTAEIYYVANQKESATSTGCTLRATGPVELWYPQTGRIVTDVPHEQTKDGRTRIPLHLEPAESLFIVLRHTPADHGDAPLALQRDGQDVTQLPSPCAEWDVPTHSLRVWSNGLYTLKTHDGQSTQTEVSDLPAPTQLDGAWTLHFPPNFGAPDHLDVPTLQSWTDFPQPDVKHFSGTATYTTTFDLTANQLQPGHLALLDLGSVGMMAHVYLNDHDLGLLWKPPYRTEVTSILKPGPNTLRIEVTNSWRNRLIGDAPAWKGAYVKAKQGAHLDQIPAWLPAGHLPSNTHTFATWQFFTGTEPLTPSGLIGPTHLLWGRQLPIK